MSSNFTLILKPLSRKGERRVSRREERVPEFILCLKCSKLCLQGARQLPDLCPLTHPDINASIKSLLTSVLKNHQLLKSQLEGLQLQKKELEEKIREVRKELFSSSLAISRLTKQYYRKRTLARFTLPSSEAESQASGQFFRGSDGMWYIKVPSGQVGAFSSLERAREYARKFLRESEL